MEKVPKKKARKGLSKGWGALLLLAVMLAAGAGAYFLRRPAAPPLEAAREKPALLWGGEEEIVSVAVRAASGEGFTLVRQEAGFRLTDRPDLPLREDVVAEMLAVCADMTAEDTVLDTAETPAALSDFQLDPPLLRVAVTLRDGTRRTVLFGAATPDGQPRRYCMADGDTRIYAVLSAHAEPFLHEAEYLRAFDQPSLRGDLLDRVTVTGSVDFDMRWTPSGWIMERPFRYPLSTLRTDAMLAKIGQMGFEACLGTADEVDLTACGLAQPALTVTLTQAATVVTGESRDGQPVTVDVPETVYTLLIGGETGKSGVYVLWDGAVYKASNFLLGFWKEIDPEALLLKEPVNLLVNDLNRLVFASGGAEKAYAVEMVEKITENNQIATDEYGRVLYDAEISRVGTKEKLDAEAFLAWYRRLAALSPAGAAPGGYTPSGGERCRIVLENAALTRVIAFTPYDALHSAMTVDGVCRYYVENSALDALLPAP